MAAGCRLGEYYVQSSICEVSPDGMTCTIPSSRIQGSLMEILHTQVSVSINNTLLDGVLSWYTVEESAYRIGIAVDRKHRDPWRRIITERGSGLTHPATRHAPV